MITMVAVCGYHTDTMVTMADAPVQRTPYRALGKRIAELRARAGLSQRELADRVHISSGYPPGIESGRARPDPSILQRIAVALDADYLELAALAGFIDPPPPAGDYVNVPATAAQAPIMRRLTRYPADVLARWEAALSTWLEPEELSRLAQPHPQAQPDTEREAEQDRDPMPS